MKFGLSLQVIVLPVVALVSCVFAAHCRCLAQDPPRRTYCIAARLIEIETTSKEERILSQPTVVTLERQTACLSVGQSESVVIEAEDTAQVETGLTCRFTPYRLKDGGVKLDLDIEIIEPADDMDEDILTQKYGMRRLQQVPLGVRVEVPLKRRGKTTHRLDLVVTETQPGVRDEVPPPPRVGRRPKPERINFRVLTPDELREAIDEWERMWDLDMPAPLPPFRTHGGVI